MISLVLYTIGKIFRADLDEAMFAIIGFIELILLDWVMALSLLN